MPLVQFVHRPGCVLAGQGGIHDLDDPMEVALGPKDLDESRRFAPSCLEGAITFEDPLGGSGPVRIASEFVTGVETKAAQQSLRIGLRIPGLLAPDPSAKEVHPFAEPIDLDLIWTKAQGWKVLCHRGFWAQEGQEPGTLSGYLDGWVHGKGKNPHLKLREKAGDLLVKLGLVSDEATGRLDITAADIGVFMHPSERTLLVAVVPNANGKHVVGLNLARLQTVPLQARDSNGDVEFPIAPSVHLLPLWPRDRRLHGRWKTFLQWRPGKPLKQHASLWMEFLSIRDLLASVWQPLADRARQGVRPLHAGSGWSAVPELTYDAPKEWARTILEFDTPGPSEPALFRQFLTYAPDPSQNAVATFRWREPASLDPGGLSAAPRRDRDALVLSGSALGSSAGIDDLEWDKEPPSGTPWMTRDTVRGLFSARSPDRGALQGRRDLGRWVFGMKAERGGSINLGSLEVDLMSGAEATLECGLHGEWTASSCDVYPEVHLRELACRVRPAPTGDPSSEQLRAVFDAAGAIEEELHRESEPLIAALGELKGVPARLSIRLVSAPGRDAVVQMELRKETHKQQSVAHTSGPGGGEGVGSSSVYLQARPFHFALLAPPELDPETGSVLAYWRSDDPDEPQWRIADPSISLRLPPQAVAEEMERGIRFWEKLDKPYIDPQEPLRYRFSPPTHLVVRPSVVPRRYHPHPNNLGRALNGAVVERFTTEVLYPIQIRFERDESGLPHIRIAESAAFFGRPAPNLPQARDGQAKDLALDVLADDLGAWASKLPDVPLDSFERAYTDLRMRHSAARANFAARLAKLHLYDPYRADRGLFLRDGLDFLIRSTNEGAPPLCNPLPRRRLEPEATNGWVEEVVPILESQEQEIRSFLRKKDGPWGKESDGSIAAGALHTIEFPSELTAILRTPRSKQGMIESLAFSTLGASAHVSMSFDEGRTTFVAETTEGQLTRLTKIRIGRIGVVWNRAKHVIVYERTVVPSAQFAAQQEASKLHGWPVLRKTEEYVELVEPLRDFDLEAEADANATGFVQTSEFLTARIYVDGAWGRDVGHGYEIPLWNAEDSSGFYPKPPVALRSKGAEDVLSRQWIEVPHELVFYTNTEPGTGSNPDGWDAKHGVDAPHGPARLDVVTKEDWSEVLRNDAIPAPRAGGSRRRRFDLVVRSDGAVNLQHRRSDAPMLAAVESVSLMRTAETAPVKDGKFGDQFAKLQELTGYSAKVANVEGALRRLIDRLPAEFFSREAVGGGCRALKQRIEGKVKGAFAEASAGLKGLTPSEDLLKQVQAISLEEEITQAFTRAGLYPLEALNVAAADLRNAVAAALAAPQAQLEEERVRSALRSALAPVRKVVTDSEATFERYIGAATDAMKEVVKEVEGIVSDLKVLVNDVSAASPKPEIEQALRNVEQNAAALRSKLATAAALPGGTSLRMLVRAAQQVEGLAQDGRARLQAAPDPARLIEAFKIESTALLDGLKTARDGVEGLLRAVATAPFEEVRKRLDRLQSLTQGTVNGLLRDLREIAALLDDDITQGANTLAAAYHQMLVTFEERVRAAAKTVDKELQGLARKVVETFAAYQGAAMAAAEERLRNLEAEALEQLASIDCDAIDYDELEKIRTKVEKRLRTAAEELKTQATEAVTGLLDETSARQVESWARDFEDTGNRIGKGLKLCKAIGDLPALPHLTFNAARAEYVFEDLDRQIRSSPFAARLREIGGGLKELGVVVPSNLFRDQIVLFEGIKPGFQEIYKHIAGMDFMPFFKNFELRGLSKDNIKITQGVDRQTRTAWAKAAVNADFPEERALFELSSMAVRMRGMSLRALTDFVIGADGSRRAATDGKLSADWTLDFGGNRLVTFEDVTVRFDGRSFSFDLDPRKVRLHPSLQFVSEFAKRFGQEIPKGIQVEKDARGVPVGARATLSTVIDLPPMGAVQIGPLTMVGGLSLAMREMFTIGAHFSIGTPQAPVFVQIGWLGGGFWLVSRAQYPLKPTFEAEVGLALGATRAIAIAGVARGSFSFLLYVSVRFTDGGGVLRAGILVLGSAQILGIASAYVRLQLEAVHSGGKTTGHGVLSLKIKICWCYTLRVHRQVKHEF